MRLKEERSEGRLQERIIKTHLRMIRQGILIALISLSVFTNGQEEQNSEKLILCSFIAQSATRRNLESFVIENLDPTLCTHIIYNYARVSSENHDIISRFQLHDFYDDGGEGLYNRTIALKERNPGLKVILRACCIDHSFWEHDTMTTEMITSTFVKNAIKYLKRYAFDGLYIDARQHDVLPDFFKALREGFDEHGLILAKSDLHIAHPGKEDKTLTTEMVEPFHLLMVMSYWKKIENATAIFSPLRALRRTVSEYLDIGIPREKMIVGIPAIGMSYKLCSRDDSGVSAEICGLGDEGENTAERMAMMFFELMQKMNNASEGWVVERDNATGMMYGHSNSLLWTSYEDTVSVRAKSQYVLEENLAGAAIMSVDMDDFVGYNQDGVKFPLTKAIYNTLHGT